jgi:hypothetical protein
MIATRNDDDFWDLSVFLLDLDLYQEGIGIRSATISFIKGKL